MVPTRPLEFDTLYRQVWEPFYLYFFRAGFVFHSSNGITTIKQERLKINSTRLSTTGEGKKSLDLSDQGFPLLPFTYSPLTLTLQFAPVCGRWGTTCPSITEKILQFTSNSVDILSLTSDSLVKLLHKEEKTTEIIFVYDVCCFFLWTILSFTSNRINVKDSLSFSIIYLCFLYCPK